ncbi:hypothetical protein OII53_04950, partial [Achromobacter ruhlandii]|nr:hypothetical protein [Achromobacter ruhlandii]
MVDYLACAEGRAIFKKGELENRLKPTAACQRRSAIIAQPHYRPARRRATPMRIRAALLLCPLALALHAPMARADTRVQSLDQVPGAIKTQDARKMYDSQMSGAPRPEG